MFWSKCRFLFPFVLFSNGLMPLFTHSATLTAHFLWEKKRKFISLFPFLPHLSLNPFMFLRGSSSLIAPPAYVLTPTLLCLPLTWFFCRLFLLTPSLPPVSGSLTLFSESPLGPVQVVQEGKLCTALLAHEAMAAAVVPAVTYHLLRMTRDQAQLPHPLAPRKTPEATLEHKPTYPMSNQFMHMNIKMREPSKKGCNFWTYTSNSPKLQSCRIQVCFLCFETGL